MLRTSRAQGAERLGGSRVFGWSAEPVHGFLDALGEGDLGLAEEGVGFVHRGHVVGHHAAVAGRGDVEGLSGQDVTFMLRTSRAEEVKTQAAAQEAG